MAIPIIAIIIILFCVFQICKKINQTNPIKKIIEPTSELNELSKTEMELQDMDYWLTIHILLCKIKSVYECDYLMAVDKEIEGLQRVVNDLKAIYDPSLHDKHANRAKKEYCENTSEKLEEYQLDIIQNFHNLDIESLRLEKYSKIINDYSRYWDSVLSEYISEHARTKRRKYLVTKLDEMIKCCHAHGYFDLIATLTDYKNAQKSFLSGCV